MNMLRLKLLSYRNITKDMKKSKEQLVEIFEDTMLCIKEGQYEDNSGYVHDLPEPTKTRLFKTVPNSEAREDTKRECKIYVQNIDTLQKAKEMGPGVVVLNMASGTRAGGGVDTGSRAQEEEICRRTTLLRSLYPMSLSKYWEFDEPEPDKWKYPIKTYGGIYTAGVIVFKSAISYNYMDRPFTISVISVSAVKRPTVKKDGMMTEQDATMMKGKIRAILRLAYRYHHTKLVLGAFGCGSYRCPPRHVATLFKEVLREKEFANCFEEICFAILEDRNSFNNTAEGNLKPFKEIIEGCM